MSFDSRVELSLGDLVGGIGRRASNTGPIFCCFSCVTNTDAKRCGEETFSSTVPTKPSYSKEKSAGLGLAKLFRNKLIGNMLYFLLPHRKRVVSFLGGEMTQEVFLTVEELASRWNKSKWWIYENRSTMQLRAIKLGNHYRFRLTDVEAWEDANLI
jgi:excisionase family DNA binding protein